MLRAIILLLEQPAMISDAEVNSNFSCRCLNIGIISCWDLRTMPYGERRCIFLAGARSRFPIRRVHRPYILLWPGKANTHLMVNNHATNVMLMCQAVGCALYVLGFGESVSGLFELGSSPWAVRGFASLAVVLLSIINIAGVKWVVKLQFVLLLILLLAGLDFAVGSFVHTNMGIRTSATFLFEPARIFTVVC